MQNDSITCQASNNKAESSKCVLVVPYAQQIPDLRPSEAVPQILPTGVLHWDEYKNGGEALHAKLAWLNLFRAIVAYKKNMNLGSMLVKAFH